MMEKILLCFVLVVAVAGHKYHPRYRKNAEDVPSEYLCPSHDPEREDFLNKIQCGEPKEVFETLATNKPYEKVTPRAVWVKRCVGFCNYHSEGTCVPTETRTRDIPIRIYNLKTDTEACATYPVTEDVGCECRAESVQPSGTDVCDGSNGCELGRRK